MDALFVSITGNTQVRLEPKDLNNKIDDTILKHLKQEMEGKCIKDGYVKEKSI